MALDKKRRVHISKYLSKMLRHSPEQIGITLEEGGWVSVDTLLAATKGHGFLIAIEELREVVEQCEKQRFMLDESEGKIRANQGHSTKVEMNFTAQTPPNILYHGTATNNIEAIKQHGLSKMKRHHVHLSSDVDTAKIVGGRHGRPVIFQVATQAMLDDEYEFFLSANGVWLVHEVPPKYLQQL